MNELLVTGCRDDQYSYDARFGRRYHGAMTHSAARDHRRGRLPAHLGPALRTSSSSALETDGYDQEPQLEGRAANKRRQIFT